MAATGGPAPPVTTLLLRPRCRRPGDLHNGRSGHLRLSSAPKLVPALWRGTFDDRRDGRGSRPLVVAARPRPDARASGPYPRPGAGRYGRPGARPGPSDPGHDPTFGRSAPGSREVGASPRARAAVVAVRRPGSGLVRGRGSSDALGG